MKTIKISGHNNNCAPNCLAIRFALSILESPAPNGLFNSKSSYNDVLAIYNKQYGSALSAEGFIKLIKDNQQNVGWIQSTLGSVFRKYIAQSVVSEFQEESSFEEESSFKDIIATAFASSDKTGEYSSIVHHMDFNKNLGEDASKFWFLDNFEKYMSNFYADCKNGIETDYQWLKIAANKLDFSIGLNNNDYNYNDIPKNANFIVKLENSHYELTISDEQHELLGSPNKSQIDIPKDANGDLETKQHELLDHDKISKEDQSEIIKALKEDYQEGYLRYENQLTLLQDLCESEDQYLYKEVEKATEDLEFELAKLDNNIQNLKKIKFD